jgi:hypothetical protein
MKLFSKTSIAGLIALFFFALPLLAQEDQTAQPASTGSAVGGAIGGLIGLVVAVVMVVAVWKVYVKAGQEGWKSIIPFYNWYVLLQIIGRPGWWLVLMLIPFVNFVIFIIVAIDLAKSFGKGGGFAVGLILLSPIFILLLAFGDAHYVGPAAGPRPIA